MFFDLPLERLNARIVRPSQCIDLLRDNGKLRQHLIHQFRQPLGKVPPLCFPMRRQVFCRNARYTPDVLIFRWLRPRLCCCGFDSAVWWKLDDVWSRLRFYGGLCGALFIVWFSFIVGSLVEVPPEYIRRLGGQFVPKSCGNRYGCAMLTLGAYRRRTRSRPGDISNEWPQRMRWCYDGGIGKNRA